MNRLGGSRLMSGVLVLAAGTEAIERPAVEKQLSVRLRGGGSQRSANPSQNTSLTSWLLKRVRKDHAERS